MASERPRHLSHVVRRRPAGGPRRPSGPEPRVWLALGLFGLAGLALAALIWFPAGATPGPAGITPLAGATSDGGTPAPPRATPEPPRPTSTFLAPSATPTRLVVEDARPTETYTVLTGDTLAAVAARFGVNPDDIRGPAALQSETTLSPGQLLSIPRVLGETGPALRLAPDSEVVYSPSAADFDAARFAAEQGGYLARYKGFVGDVTQRGGDVIHAIGEQHSIHPRLLVALLEHMGGWVTNPNPDEAALRRPLGYDHPYRDELGAQLNWAANQLEIGYYGWRAGTLTELTFPDGGRLRLDPTLNAGTVALQYFFAQLYNRPAWDEAVGAGGFAGTYQRLFGDPQRYAFDLIPGNLAQPQLALPFIRGQTWYFSGGPHGAWENGGAQAALDFAPSSLESGCADSDAWVTAVAAGRILRSGRSGVVLDLDGDGREITGWVVFYLHLADRDRVAAGTTVERGDRLGHPSCEGGRSTGTHVHIARKYNGEWIPADSAVPFNLEGWVARRGKGEYFGRLEREGVTIESCTCTAAYTAITAGR